MRTGLYPTRTTEPAVSPLFLVGAGYRLAEAVTFGLGVYPVAAAAGEYRMTNITGTPYIDKTRLVFLEISPAVSVEILKGLYLGAGYRATITTLERVKGVVANPQEFNFTVKGVDAAGIRVGVQYHPSDNFSVGLVYRHRIAPELKADKATAGFFELRDGRTTFVLPSKLGVGVSGKMDRLHGALDLEYGFYSQNTTTTLSGPAHGYRQDRAGDRTTSNGRTPSRPASGSNTCSAPRAKSPFASAIFSTAK